MNILENSERHLEEFVRLNEEWISKYFSLEEADHKLANNPGSVINSGGFIFTLVHESEVLGVCALFNDGNGVYELARMAVSEKHQGKGYGNKLIEAAIDKATQLSASKLYLVSNTKLEAAIALYVKYGFEITYEGQHPVYSRANIAMVKE